MRGDGTDDVLSLTFPVVAPATTPFFRFAIARTNTWAVNNQVIGGGCGAILMNATTPKLRLSDGVAGTEISAAVGTFFALISQQQNSVADYFQVGLLRASGTAVGNATNGTTFLFAGTLTTNFAADDIAEVWAFQGTAPTFDQLGKMIRYAINKYGPTIMGPF